MKSNPFSTRYVAPGQIAWVDARPKEIANLARQFFSKYAARAAIVGPHGSGKTTLLEFLVPRIGKVVTKLDVAGRAALPTGTSASAQSTVIDLIDWHRCNDQPADYSVVWLTLRGAKASANLLRSAWQLCDTKSVLVLDGYEQLSLWSRYRAVVKQRSRNCGLLLTSHKPTYLPTLIETSVTPDLARRILQQLLDTDTCHRTWFMDEARLENLLKANRGNFREVLMAYYDRFEAIHRDDCRTTPVKDRAEAELCRVPADFSPG